MRISHLQAPTKSLGSLALVMALSGSLSAQFVNPPPTFEAARWVSEHKAALPVRYSEFVKYPFEYRRRIYPELSAAQKASLWHEQFRLLQNANIFNAKQKAFVQMVDGRIDDLIARGDSVAAKALEIEGQKLFDRDLYRSVFTSLGPLANPVPLQSTGPTRSGPIFTTATSKTASVFSFASFSPRTVGLGSKFSNCECSVYSDWCPQYYLCTSWSCSQTCFCGTVSSG